MTTFTINPNDLEAVSLAASHEETRYYLCGVSFEIYDDNTVGMVATDGHRVASIHAKQNAQPKETFILGNGDIKKIMQMVKLERKNVGKRNQASVKIAIDRQGVVLSLSCIVETKEEIKTAGQFTTKEIDGNFPDWRRVIPSYADDGAGCSRLSFNTSYMADFGRVARIFGVTIESVVIDIIDKNSPIKITLPGIADSFLGVLMPTRC